MKKSDDIRSFFTSFVGSGSKRSRKNHNNNDDDPAPPKKRDRKKEEEEALEKKRKSRSPTKKAEVVADVSSDEEDEKVNKRRSKKRKSSPEVPHASSSSSSSVAKTIPKKKSDDSSPSKKTPTKVDKKRKIDSSQDTKTIPVSTPTKKDDKKRKIDTSSSAKTTPVSTPTKGKADKKKDDTPSKDKEDKKRQGYARFMSRGAPKHLGSKEFPEAEPNCLDGKAFVLTGVLESFERDDVADVIKKYGGRVVTSISKKVNYVIVGDEAGESKLQKAKTLGIPQLTEDGFLTMLSQYPVTTQKRSKDKRTKHSQDSDAEDVQISPPKAASSKSKSSSSSSSSSKSKPSSSSSTPSSSKASSSSKSKSSSSSSSSKKSHTDSKQKSKAKGKSSAASTSSMAGMSVPSVSTPTSSQLWVDKYKPTNLKSIIGQTGDNSNAKKLLRWLQNWFKYHGAAGEKVTVGQGGLKDPEGKTFNAALLSGPPGIGKTTTAQLCCKELGYTFSELNASDKRNKGCLKGALSDQLDNLTLNFTSGGNKTNNKMKRRHVVIMDEVDGMSGNQDRGGIAELILLLKRSRVPIICICNDRNAQKIRSLANYCFDLRFRHPSNEQLKGFIQSICFKESLTIPKEKQQQLITSTDHDVRQILHQLQMFKEADAPEAYNPRKDLHFGPWDVARKVFSSKDREGMNIRGKELLFFHDYQMGPLFVQENYLRCNPKAAGGDPYKTMDLMKATAESLALGDRVENIIRRTTNNWNLLPVQALYQSVLPGEYMEGEGNNRIEFPTWFGKNSNQGKQSRLLQQLQTHMHLHVSGSLGAINMEYLPYLRRAIVKPLSKGDIDVAASYMTNYSLIREDLDTINEVALWPNMRDLLSGLDAKSKAAFTRQVNKDSFVPYSVIKTVSKRGRGGGGIGEDDEVGLEEDGEEAVEVGEDGEGEEEVEEDEIKNDAMIKQKKSKVKAGDSNKTKASNASKSRTPKASNSKSKRRK